MDKYQYISYTHFIETYIIRISKLQFHHGVVLQFETKKNFDNFGCLYRRFINRIQNFARIKGSLFTFVVLVAKTWNASSWCKYTYRRSQSTAAISKMAKGREGKERRIIKVVDSSFRFTRVVRFASATGQFFFVPREPMVSRSTISTRPAIPGIRAHVYIPVPQIDKTLMEAI